MIQKTQKAHKTPLTQQTHMTQLNIRLDEKRFSALKRVADQQGISVSQLTRHFIHEGLADHVQRQQTGWHERKERTKRETHTDNHGGFLERHQPGNALDRLLLKTTVETLLLGRYIVSTMDAAVVETVTAQSQQVVKAYWQEPPLQEGDLS